MIWRTELAPVPEVIRMIWPAATDAPSPDCNLATGGVVPEVLVEPVCIECAEMTAE